MRIVEDDTGNRYLLLKRSQSSSLVRDLDSGERRHVPTHVLTVIEDQSPLASAASELPAAAVKLITAVRNERTVGLLVALEAAGGLSARQLLEAEDYCESDLNGLVTELRSGGLIEPTTIEGEDGYQLTEPTAAIIRSLQSATAVD
jgi:hypothetical protein